ncbi:MAG TPA: DUF371 domain-containing protein [Thermoleophilaceae bacterium]|jgi:hypothetical protein
MPAAVSGTARSHPAIRASHRKTLELTRDAEITERATCVVGVGARLDERALAGLHGPVELTLSVDAREQRVRGRLNPAFQPGDPLVVRRADAVTRDALIVGADRAASDLARDFVAELAKPGARIALSVEPTGERGPGVLVVEPAATGEAAAGEAAAAVADGRAALSAVAQALAAGRRVTLRADLADAAARAAIRAAHDAGHTVLPAPGLALADALRASGGLAPAAEVVAGVPAESLARRLRGAGRAAIALDPGTPREQFVYWRSGERLALPGARGRRAALAVEADGEGEPGGDADVAALARAEALAATGGSTRDVARTLQDAGLPHRRAYELALGLTASTSSVARPEPRTSR